VPNYVITDLTRQTASILRGLIARYGVTQTQMAEAVGVSQSQLSKMIRGTRPIDLDQLTAMCEALDASPSKVLAEAEDFLINYATPYATKYIFVNDGIRQDPPIVVAEQAVQWTEPVVPEVGSSLKKTNGQS